MPTHDPVKGAIRSSVFFELKKAGKTDNVVGLKHRQATDGKEKKLNGFAVIALTRPVLQTTGTVQISHTVVPTIVPR